VVAIAVVVVNHRSSVQSVGELDFLLKGFHRPLNPFFFLQPDTFAFLKAALGVEVHCLFYQLSCATSGSKVPASSLLGLISVLKGSVMGQYRYTRSFPLDEGLANGNYPIEQIPSLHPHR